MLDMCRQTFVYIRMYVRMHIYVYVYVYICVYTYTYLLYTCFTSVQLSLFDPVYDFTTKATSMSVCRDKVAGIHGLHLFFAGGQLNVTCLFLLSEITMFWLYIL